MGDEFENIEEQVEFARQEERYQHDLECRAMEKRNRKYRTMYLVVLVLSVIIVSCLATQHNKNSCGEPLTYTKG